MSSQTIEDFIEHSVTVPREVIRLCKLIKEVDDVSNQKMVELTKNRQKFLQNKKVKAENLTDLKSEIDKDHKYLLELNDYKIKHLQELEFIVKSHIIEVNISTKEYEDEFRKAHGCSPRKCKHNFFNFYPKKFYLFLIYIYKIIFFESQQS
jgi:hypothetical protein